MRTNIIKSDNKDLLVELQNYLIDIDEWHTQIMLSEYREKVLKWI